MHCVHHVLPPGGSAVMLTVIPTVGTLTLSRPIVYYHVHQNGKEVGLIEASLVVKR